MSRSFWCDLCSAEELFKLDYFVPVTGKGGKSRAWRYDPGCPHPGSAPAGAAGMLRWFPLSNHTCEIPASLRAEGRTACFCVLVRAHIHISECTESMPVFRGNQEEGCRSLKTFLSSQTATWWGNVHCHGI